jgi:hypothetical protein
VNVAVAKSKFAAGAQCLKRLYPLPSGAPASTGCRAERLRLRDHGARSGGDAGEVATYRQYALLYCLLVGVGGALLQRRGLKPHFFGTYLNIVANVLFWAVLSGVFIRQGYGLWVLALLIACGASLAWGLIRRQFAFVAYAAVYGYVGVSSLFLRGVTDESAVLSYFVVSGVAMLGVLVQIGRRFGRSA